MSHQQPYSRPLGDWVPGSGKGKLDDTTQCLLHVCWTLTVCQVLTGVRQSSALLTLTTALQVRIMVPISQKESFIG